jgi:hypothetical protein
MYCTDGVSADVVVDIIVFPSLSVDDSDEEFYLGRLAAPWSWLAPSPKNLISLL